MKGVNSVGWEPSVDRVLSMSFVVLLTECNFFVAVWEKLILAKAVGIQKKKLE